MHEIFKEEKRGSSQEDYGTTNRSIKELALEEGITERPKVVEERIRLGD